MIQGSITIHLGSKIYKAKKGESFYFVSDKKHYLTSKSGAVILWVGSPPSFYDQFSQSQEETIWEVLLI